MTIAALTPRSFVGLPAVADKHGWPWDVPECETDTCEEERSSLPRITIITSSYNRCDFIEETLRGTILQNYPNTELIVVDGASTDGTLEILSRYEAWITRFLSEKDTGEYNAVNKGFHLATGDIVTFNSSDDVYCPGVFHEVAKLFRAHPEAGAYAGGFYRMDERSAPLSAVIPATYPFPGPHDLSTCSQGEWRLHQQALFYRARALEKVGMFLREDLRYSGDRELLYRVCNAYPVEISAMTFAGFRVHENSLTTGSATREKADREFLVLQKSFFRKDGKDAARRKLARQLHAKIWVNKGRFAANPIRALLSLLVAAICHPSVIRSYAFQRGVLRALRLKR